MRLPAHFSRFCVGLFLLSVTCAPSVFPQRHARFTGIRMSGPQAHKLIQREVPPVYPEEAKRKRVHGTVRLRIVIGTKGLVNQIDVVSGPSQLEAAAVEAVRQWQYQVSYFKGQPVEVETVVALDFKLT